MFYFLYVWHLASDCRRSDGWFLVSSFQFLGTVLVYRSFLFLACCFLFLVSCPDTDSRSGRRRRDDGRFLVCVCVCVFFLLAIVPCFLGHLFGHLLGKASENGEENISDTLFSTGFHVFITTGVEPNWARSSQSACDPIGERCLDPFFFSPGLSFELLQRSHFRAIFFVDVSSENGV